MSKSLRTYFDRVTRKNDPVDPRAHDPRELAGLLHGSPAAIEAIERHMVERPELWQLDPADLMRELVRLPGVGKGTAAWWTLNELQVGQRARELAAGGASRAAEGRSAGA